LTSTDQPNPTARQLLVSELISLSVNSSFWQWIHLLISDELVIFWSVNSSPDQWLAAPQGDPRRCGSIYRSGDTGPTTPAGSGCLRFSRPPSFYFLDIAENLRKKGGEKRRNPIQEINITLWKDGLQVPAGKCKGGSKTK
jgi:hypothetical protein